MFASQLAELLNSHPAIDFMLILDFDLLKFLKSKDSIAHVSYLLTNLIDSTCTYLPCCILAVLAACATRQLPWE